LRKITRVTLLARSAARHGAGSIAGEIALLYDASRIATVVAGTAMRFLVLDLDEFSALLELTPCIERYRSTA
jgi:CRP-like cAMP-binding protein